MFPPLTRRALLQQAAAAPALRLPKKIRLVLIGLQGHPSEVYGQLDRLPDIEFAGLADTDEKEAAAVRRRPRLAAAPFYRDWREMLDKEKPDLVAICNAGGPPRVEAIVEVTRRGLPWIAEKPLANDRAGLDRVRSALKQHPVPYSMLLPMRFDPQYRALRDIARAGQLGEIGQISAQKSYKAGDRPEWMRNPVTYGGTIPWIGIHMVDLMRYTSGRNFTEAFSFQTQVGAPAGIGRMENTTGTVFRMDNGGIATLHMDYYRPESAPTHGDDRLRLAGTQGVAEYMEATGVTLIAAGRKPERLTSLPPRGSVFLDFLESLYHGKKSELTPGEIFRNCESVLAAHESARSGRAVKIG